jgi:hypothetical protein
MQEVVSWMFHENPDVWYLPEAATKQNKVGQTINLTFRDAAEIFQEMEKRGFIEPFQVNIEWIDDQKKPQRKPIIAWRLDRAATSDIHEFMQLGAASIFWRSLKRFVWDDEDNRWHNIVVVVAAILGGFFVKIGEDIYILTKSGIKCIVTWILG